MLPWSLELRQYLTPELPSYQKSCLQQAKNF
jgi:hypothetical protein